ncbi:hypothetical protein P171DRAFT_478704 [Karstenula rhodostoma CBS 690.94]|uniref:Uncharacterized protein n=1 Tax=Karstenula rhodostoma CBS 690.94 TaxID=1392251 RepID=A0A9P4UIF8_9PLEO|nr:hypothetical protein P171DRAFT_478704 [Karstenula rhodostoma CBS 690.94]
MAHEYLVVSRGAPKPFSIASGDAGPTEALAAELDDIDALTDTGSDTEPENEHEPGARFKGLVAEDERAYRPTNGYGQRPWAISNRARSQKPMYNVTIGFARHMQERGHDIHTLPLQQRLIIQELLEADRKHKEKGATEAAQTAVAKLPKVRPRAVDVFPGVIPPKKRVLHWGVKENFVGMKNHFNGLQFRRALYDDGVDIEGLEAMKAAALVSMWMQRRDELHSRRALKADIEEVGDGASNVLLEGTEGMPAVPGNVQMGAPTREGPVDGPFSMAAMYSSQKPKAVYEAANAEHHSGASTPNPTLGDTRILTANVPSSLATTQGFGQIGASLSHTTFPNAVGNTTVLLTTNTTSSTQAVRANNGRGRKKNGQNDAEKARREALAARVGRYPLSLVGNNKGEPLSMNLKLSAFTIKQKYNKNMTTQLLKDYDILPTDPRDLTPHEKLAEHLVKEREKLFKSGAKLQEPWTHTRLEEYVAAQEAKGAIGPAFSVSGAGPANLQVPLHRSSENSKSHPSSKKSESMTGAKEATAGPSAISGISVTKKKRSREESDLQNGEIETLFQKRPRKVAKIEKGAQATSQEPNIPSAYVATDYGAAFHSRPVPIEAPSESHLSSSTYAPPTLDIYQQLPTQDETSLTNWDHQLQKFQDGTEQPPQWSNTERLNYEQQSSYQGCSASDNAYQNDYSPPSQVPASTYTMPSAPNLTNDTTLSAVPEFPIDPALLGC